MTTSTHATYEYGETVNVSLTGTVMLDDQGGLIIVLPSGHHVGITPADAEIRRSIPADGHPMPGDIWADRHGQEHFVAGTTPAGTGRYLIDTRGTQWDWAYLHQGEDGPIRLVRQAVTADIQKSTSDGAV